MLWRSPAGPKVRVFGRHKRVICAVSRLVMLLLANAQIQAIIFRMAGVLWFRHRRCDLKYILWSI